MEKERELANKIIDRVEEVILENNPDIDINSKRGNTLLYGEPYYDLEDEITDIIKELVGGRNDQKRSN